MLFFHRVSIWFRSFRVRNGPLPGHSVNRDGMPSPGADWRKAEHASPPWPDPEMREIISHVQPCETLGRKQLHSQRLRATAQNKPVHSRGPQGPAKYSNLQELVQKITVLLLGFSTPSIKVSHHFHRAHVDETCAHAPLLRPPMQVFSRTVRQQLVCDRQ